MTDYRPRLFTSDAEIAHLAEGLIARTLTKPEWTHEAHLGATTYLLLKRPDIDVDEDLPDLIRRFNESVGGVNSDNEGSRHDHPRVPPRHPPVSRRSRRPRSASRVGQ